MGILKNRPSVEQILAAAISTLTRFPLAMLCATIGTCALLLIAQDFDAERVKLLARIVMAVSLGLPLFIGLQINCETRSLNKTTHWALQALALALLVFYFFSLPENPVDPEAIPIRHVILLAVVHFFVAVAPFIGLGENTFWQFNKTLATRFLLVALYTGILFAGLSIALSAIDQLFGVDINDKRYVQLWFVLVALFHPWVFLAVLPGDARELERDTSYPRWLKVFAQFALLPLMAAYAVILYAYVIKIIIQWSWPEGWVSAMIIWYAVVGVLTLLLLHPLNNDERYRWVNAITKWFYRGLIPLMIVLPLAILRRTNEYGITESRYLGLVISAVMIVIVIYFVVSKQRNIRAIPLTLAVVGIISAYGPWSAFSVSLASQQERFQELLEKHNLTLDGVSRESQTTIPGDDRAEMTSIARYLDNRHGADAFDRWISADTLSNWTTDSTEQFYTKVIESLGFEPVYSWTERGGISEKTLINNNAESSASEVNGFDYHLRIGRYWAGSSANRRIAVGDNFISTEISYDSSFVSLKFYDDEYVAKVITIDTLVINFLPLIEQYNSLPDSVELPVSNPAPLDYALRNYNIRINIRKMEVTKEKGKEPESWRLSSLDADVLLKSIPASD